MRLDHWSAAVLCGGRSTRMGSDKALLPGPDGPWAAGVAAAIRAAGIDDVSFVGGDATALAVHGPVIEDDDPGAGPLAAVATFARRRPGRSILVCACDLPALDAPSLRPLLEAVERGDRGVTPLVEGRPAWSVLALSAGGAAAVCVAVEAGARALHEGAAAAGVVGLDLPVRPFVDVDTPGEGTGRGPVPPEPCTEG